MSSRGNFSIDVPTEFLSDCYFEECPSLHSNTSFRSSVMGRCMALAVPEGVCLRLLAGSVFHVNQTVHVSRGGQLRASGEGTLLFSRQVICAGMAAMGVKMIRFSAPVSVSFSSKGNLCCT